MTQRANSSASPDLERWRREDLPRHVAFIMDGNGRWANRRGLIRLKGHEKGADSLRRITRCARRLGIEEVTFYALSTENFERRPPSEIGFLMRLLRRYLVGERGEMMENGIRLKSIGDVDALEPGVVSELRESERLTSQNQGMVLRLALNYGSRQEILRAVGRVAAAISAGELTCEAARQLREDDFGRYFYDPSMTDPDLLIRTAGEFRLSNFLLWQCSYTEIWTTDALWPEFEVVDFEQALESYVSRERKYGAVGDGAKSGSARTRRD